MEETQRRSNVMVYTEALNIVAAIWLIASPYILRYFVWSDAKLTADFFGALILGMAITRMSMSQPRYWWLSFGNIIFGIWVAVSPFVLGFHYNTRATVNDIIVGIVVALIAASGLLRPRA